MRCWLGRLWGGWYLAAQDRADVSDSIAAPARRQSDSWVEAPDRALRYPEQGRSYSARHDSVIGQIVEIFDPIHGTSVEYWQRAMRGRRGI